MTTQVVHDGGEQEAGHCHFGYHDGRTWTVPADGAHTLRVRVEPPIFMRHVEVEVEGVQIARGQD